MIGSTAEATIFQFSISLLIYNVMKLIQAQVSREQKVSPEAISLPKIIRTLKKQLIAILTIVSAARVADAVLQKNRNPENAA